MNERIKELWEQAVRGDGPHASVIADFAELIVRECAEVVYSRSGHATPQDLYEHFGVES
jgi:hypothetical protein